MYYFGARYLDPQTSRWMSVDPALASYLPVVPNSDEAMEYNKKLPGIGGVFNQVNLNLYHYAGNNPLIYRDPTGTETEENFENDWESESDNLFDKAIDLAKDVGQWIVDNKWELLEFARGVSLEILGFICDLGTVAEIVFSVPTAGGTLALVTVTISGSTLAKAAGGGMIVHSLYRMSTKSGNTNLNSKNNKKYIKDNWSDKTTFHSKKASAKYHWKKHGRGLSFKEYTKKATDFFKNFSKNPGKYKSKVNPDNTIRIDGNEGSGLYDSNGKIIWFEAIK